jgi:hypothetical protein
MDRLDANAARLDIHDPQLSQDLDGFANGPSIDLKARR